MSDFYDLSLPQHTNGVEPRLWYVEAIGIQLYLLRDTLELKDLHQGCDLMDYYFASEADAIKAAHIYYRSNNKSVPQRFPDRWNELTTEDLLQNLGVREESQVMEFV